MWRQLFWEAHFKHISIILRVKAQFGNKLRDIKGSLNEEFTLEKCMSQDIWIDASMITNPLLPVHWFVVKCKSTESDSDEVLDSK